MKTAKYQKTFLSTLHLQSCELWNLEGKNSEFLILRHITHQILSWTSRAKKPQEAHGAESLT